jgi:hypothetical protein
LESISETFWRELMFFTRDVLMCAKISNMMVEKTIVPTKKNLPNGEEKNSTIST